MLVFLFYLPFAFFRPFLVVLFLFLSSTSPFSLSIISFPQFRKSLNISDPQSMLDAALIIVNGRVREAALGHGVPVQTGEGP